MKRFSILTTLFVLFLAVSSTFAAIPQLIPYQANVIDQDNKALNGTYSVTFELYDTPNGGTPIWTVNRSVGIDNGYINVMLGEVNPFAGVNFSKQLYLQVTVGNGTPYPRTKLGATPYAFEAISAVDADTALVAKDVVDGIITWVKFDPAATVAGGDLQGNYPNPMLRDGVVLENIKPGSITQKYLAPNVTVPPSGKAGGDLSGQYPDPIIAKGAVKTDRIADGAVTLEKMASNSVNSDNIINNTIMLADLNDEVKNVGGDLDGTLPNPTVVGFQGYPVSSAMPWDGAVYMFNGEGWVPMNAAGDVAGPYNNLQLQPGVVTTLEILDGTIVDADVAANAAIQGTKIYPDFGAQDIMTMGDLYADNGYFNYNVYGANFYGDTFMGMEGEFDYLTVNMETNLNGLVNITAPQGIFVNGHFDLGANNNLILEDEFITSGDLTGYYEAPIIRDLAVTTNKIADGAVNSAKIADFTITDMDVAPNAAIKGTKILPDFGNQTIRTTGSFDVGGNITNSGGPNVTVDDNLIVTGDLQVNGTINLANVNAVNVTATNGKFTNLEVTNPINGSMIGNLYGGLGIEMFTYNGGADAQVNVLVDETTIAVGVDNKLYLMDNAVTNNKIADNAVGLNEMQDNSVGPNELINTAVVAGTYGTQTAVGQFSVDADGRLTMAQNVNILVNDDAVNSDIDITGATSDMLNLQIRPSTVGSDEIIDGSINYTDLNGSGGAKGQQLTSDGSGNVYWADAMALPYEGALATGEDAFKISQNHATMGTAAIFNSTIAQNMDNAVEITKDVADGAGSALYVYGIGVMGKNYIAKFENQNLAEGRTAFFKSKSPAGASGMWNVNNGFDGIYNTPDDFVNLDPTDVIEATVVVDNIGPNQSNQQLAIKTYGSIQANSAVIASNLVGTTMLTLGTGTPEYGEILAPVSVSGQAGTPQMYVNPGFYIDGSVDITGYTHGVMGADFDATMNVDGNTTLNADIWLGNANTDNVYFVADVNSNIIPNLNYTYDLGSPAQRWDDIYMQNLWAVNGYFTGNLEVDGNTRLGDAIGDAVVLNGTITSNLGPVYINDQLHVTGYSDFDNNVNIDGTLNVVGDATFHNALTQDDAAQPVSFAGATTVNNTLHVTNNADFDMNVEVNGYIHNTLGDVTVNDNLVVTGTSNLQNAIFNSTGNHGGQVYINDALEVVNNADFDANVNIDGNTQNDGTLNVDGATTLNSTLDVDGVTTLNNDVYLGNANNDNIYFVGDVNSNILPNIDNTYDLGSVAQSWRNIYSDGTIFGVNVYLTGNLDVDGNTRLGNAIGDAVVLNGTITSALGPVYVNDQLHVTGNADFDANVEVNGYLHNTLGDLTVNDNLVVTGTSNLQNAIFNSTGNNGGQVYINDALEVVGNADFDANVNIDGNTQNDGTLNVDGNTTLNANVWLGNATTDNVYAQGTISSTFGDVLINDAVQDPNSDFVINDNLNVTGNTDLDGTLLVNGTSQFNQFADFDANVNIDGSLQVDLTLNVDGATTLNSTLDVDGATTLNGNVTLGDAAADNIVFAGDVNSNILPNTDNTFDLGSVAQSWKDIYYDGTLVGGDGHFQNLRVDVNTDLRGPIFNTVADGIGTPLWFDDDLIPNVNNTYDIGSTSMFWRNVHTAALNTWGPGGITVNNAGGINIVGSGGLSIASGGANIVGGVTVTGELTANNNINAKANIYNSGGDVTVNDNLQVNGNYAQAPNGSTVLGYSTPNSLATLASSTGTVINLSGVVGLIDATIDLPTTVQNGKVIYLINSGVAGITVWNLTGTTTVKAINPGDMASFVYVGGWRLLQ